MKDRFKNIVKEEVKQLITEIERHSTFNNVDPSQNPGFLPNTTSMPNLQMIYDHVSEASALCRQFGLWDIVGCLMDAKALLDSKGIQFNYDQRIGMPDGEADLATSKQRVFQHNESVKKRSTPKTK